MSTIEQKSVSKSLKVGKYVGKEHVDTVIRTYKQERWIHNTERLGKEDSLSSWYSVEELERFLETVKASGGNGVRIYFGAYPSDFKVKPEYAGLQTMVLVATKTKQLEDNSLVHKEVYINKENGADLLAYNLGSLCPPLCQGTPTTQKLGVTIVEGNKGMNII